MTLDPSAALANATTYVATVRGGASGDIRLVTLGDSITSTRSVDVHPCGNGWPAFLTLPLADFHNAGIAGNTTTQMLARLSPDVLAHTPTDVTIMGGTNDLSAGFPTATTLANLGSIIDQVRAAGATAWLQTIPPRSTTPATIQAVITLNAALRTLAGQRGARLIDTWAALAGPGGSWASAGYVCDTVHPTDTGAAVIAANVQAALSAGVKDVAGNPLAADRSWTFTTAAAPGDTTAPTITALGPTDGATGQPTGTNATATFSEPIDPATLTGATVSLVVQGTSTPLAASVTYDGPSRTVTLDPSAALANATTYVATVRGGASGVKDVAGNPLAADRSWTFTTAAAPGGTTSYLSDLAYTVVSNGFGPAEKDRSNGEAGAADGRPLTLAGVVYPKGIGVHAPSEIRYNLTGCSTFTTKVGLDDEVGSNGSLSFQIWGDAVKLADSGIMTGTSPTQTLTVDLTGRSQLRLIVDPNGPGWHDHGDWADARLTCAS